MSETPLYNQIILAHSANYTRLFRMQVGTFRALHSDHIIKIGVPGFSDLFGWKSRIITSDMVGKRIAQFVAIECKFERGHTNRDTRQRQESFLTLVEGQGGVSGYARSVDEAGVLLLGGRK